MPPNIENSHKKIESNNRGSDENIIIVPIRDFAFDRLSEDKIYAYPASSGKRILDYMAFYRPEPVGAITHYGKVESVSEGDIDMQYRAICFGDKANEDAILVHLDSLEEFETPVEGVGYGVQGPMYTNLNSSFSAETLEDLD